MLGQIRIIATPPGEAPEWVRCALVGVKLRPYSITTEKIDMVGVVSGNYKIPYTGYSVMTTEVIRALWEFEKFEVVKWWRQNPRFNDNQSLRFPMNVCECVE